MAVVQTTEQSLSGLFKTLADTPSCARCLLGAYQKGIMDAEKAVGSKAFYTSITQDLDFWKAFMLFLFAPRTYEETKSLLDDFSHCSCRLSDAKILGYHRFGRVLEKDLLSRTCADSQTSSIAFFTNLFRTLTCALEKAHLKAVAKRTAANWPTCPEDLMPFGPDNLMESIIMWSRFIPDTIVFRVASQCIRFCGSLLIPSVVKSGLTRHVVDAGRQLFDRTWSTLRLRAEGRRRSMGNAFRYQVDALLLYFSISFDEQTIENRKKILEDYEMKAVQILSLLAYLADDPQLFLVTRDDCKYRLSVQAMGIYRSLRHYVDPIPQILLYPTVSDLQTEFMQQQQKRDEVEDETIPSLVNAQVDVYDPECEVPPMFYDSVARTTLAQIRTARFDLRCSAPSCLNTIQSTGREFRRCDRCSVALYCSKQCQSNAWSAEKFPHKSFCKVLQRMLSIGGGAEIVFRCPPPTSNSAALCYPDELIDPIVESWRMKKVLLCELLHVTTWAAYREYPVPLPMKPECEPGYADYDELLKCLSSREGALQPKYLIVEKGMSHQLFCEMTSTFEALRI